MNGNTLVIKTKIFNEDIKKCNEKVKKIIDRTDILEDIFTIRITRDDSNDEEKVKNYLNVLLLINHLNKIKHRIKTIFLNKKDEMSDLLIKVLSKMLEINIEKMITYEI